MRRIDVLAIVMMAALAAVWLFGCPRDEQAAQAELPAPAAAPEPGAAPPIEVAPAAPAPGQSAEISVAPAQPVPGSAAPAPQAAAGPTPAPTPAASAPAPAPSPAPAASAPPAAATPPAAAASAPAVSAPPAETGTVVIGRITLVSHVPDPSEVPYTECLTMIKYTVESVASGSYAEKELLAAFWGMRDAKLQPAAKFQVGQRHRLVIEPLADHPDLQRAMQADDTNEFALAPQWVVSYSAP